MPSKPSRTRLLGHALRVAVGFPFFAIYGLVIALRALTAPLRSARRLVAARADRLVCPNGHANDMRGRFACGRCGGEYHGWVGRCEVCGAGAGWTPCRVCGVAIRFPWRSW